MQTNCSHTVTDPKKKTFVFRHGKVQSFCTFWFDYDDFSSDYATLNKDMPCSFAHKHEKPMTDCYPRGIPKVNWQFAMHWEQQTLFLLQPQKPPQKWVGINIGHWKFVNNSAADEDDLSWQKSCFQIQGMLMIINNWKYHLDSLKNIFLQVCYWIPTKRGSMQKKMKTVN